MLSKRSGLWILLFLCAFSGHVHGQLPEYEVICIFDDAVYDRVESASIAAASANRTGLRSMSASDVENARTQIENAMNSAYTQAKREFGIEAAVAQSFQAMGVQEVGEQKWFNQERLQSFDVESAGVYVVQGSSAATQAFEEKIKGTRGIKEVRRQGRIQVFGKEDTTSPMAGGAFWGVTKIGADKVWPQYTGNGITVAVIDTGIIRNHSAFKNGSVLSGYNAIIPGTPFDDNDLRHRHGTHVAGIIAGQNGMGVAPDAKIFPVLALGEGATLEGTLLRAIEVAIDNNVDIVNMSLGAIGNPNNSDRFDNQFARAKDKNICVVVAAGNYPMDPPVAGDDGRVTYPGRHSRVITVGAVDRDDSSPAFSRPTDLGVAQLFTGRPQLSAPGVGILSAGAGSGGTHTLQGTSQAAPHVAGAIALMKQKNRALTPDQVLTALTSTVAPNTKDERRGAGRIDVAKAIGLPDDDDDDDDDDDEPQQKKSYPCDNARIARLETVLDFWKRKNQQPITAGYGFGTPFMGGVAITGVGIGQMPVPAVAVPPQNIPVEMIDDTTEQILQSAADTRAEVRKLSESLEQIRLDVDLLKNPPPAPSPTPATAP